MTDFKAKMHQIRFRRWWSLQRSPRPLSWIWGPTSKEREREGRGGREGEEGKGGEGNGGEGRGGEGKERALSPPPTIWRKFTPMTAPQSLYVTKELVCDPSHGATFNDLG